MDGHQITTNPIHLGLGGTADIEPNFTGDMAWFAGYGARHDSDGADGRLVMMSKQSGSWDSWEMHPAGHEVVLCVAGSITLHQERPDGVRSTATISAGQYLINDPGVWHTADVEDEATVLFVTAGAGTEHRPR